VRAIPAGAALTSDSGEFTLAMTANLHVGMAAVFHVKDWVIIKPCENKMGRAYLRDPSAEPLELLVLAPNDPKLKSPKTKEAMQMIECLLVEEASQFPSKPKAAGNPRSSLLHERHPFTGEVEDEYAGADLKVDRCTTHCYYLQAAAFYSPVSESHADVSAADPSGTGDGVEDEFLARKSKELGLSGEELQSAIDEWGKSAKDPYQRGLAALHERRYAEASQYISASIPSSPGALLGRYVPLARAEYEQAHYPAAETALRKVLAVHSNDPVVLNNLALTLSAQGKNSEAESVLKQGLVIDEKVLGPDNAEVGNLLNSMGTIYFFQGRYSEAEPLYLRALTIDENAFGPDHPADGVVLNNLGTLYHNWGFGHSFDAERSFRRSIRILEKAGGPDNPALGDPLSNLAESLLYQDSYVVGANEKEGEQLLTRALAIDEKALGPDHPKVATDLARLGFLYAAQGKSGEGNGMLNRALAIDEKALGPDHPEVASVLNQLGLLSFYGGKYSEAEKLFRRALTIDQKALGPDHPNLAVIADSLAKTLSKLGRDPEAQVYEKQAAAIRAKSKQ
jgi:tetratricopeptide (TPR) repeat protein